MSVYVQPKDVMFKDVCNSITDNGLKLETTKISISIGKDE